MGRRERPEQVHLHDAQLRPAGVQVLDRLADRLGAGAHEHDHAVGVGGAEIVEQPVVPAGQRREPVHRRLDDRRDRRVERVRRLAALEVHVRVLRDAAHDRPVRIERARAVREHQLVVDHRAHVVVVEHLDLADFVRRAEAVEEVDERDARGERGVLRDERQVVRFLHRARTEHRPAGHPRGHDVGVIAEDRERLRGEGARGDVEDRRRQLAGDLEHVRDHQQQTLRRREGRRQRAGLQRAVHGAGGAALALHLDDVRHGAPDVGLALGGPLVGQLAHRRRGRDRIDRADLVDAVCDRGGGLVPVERLDACEPSSTVLSVGAQRCTVRQD